MKIINSYIVMKTIIIIEIDLFRLRETIFMNMQIRRDVILDTLMAAVNVLRQWKMSQFQSWRAAGCALFKQSCNVICKYRLVWEEECLD